MMAYQQLKDAFESTPLFESKTWRLSPRAFGITPDQLELIEQVGRATLSFHRALETLYLRSAQGKNLLRNQKLEAPWVAQYLDQGKPESLIRHAREERLKGATPLIFRPDLLITDDGFALSEMDSVPGGIGLTAFLNGLYEDSADQLVGSQNSMLDAFYDALSSSVSERSFPFIAILVSDEAATYRPEMEWLATRLQRRGKRVFVFHPREVMPLGNSLCVAMDGNPQKIDIVYRFWELFDWQNVSTLESMLDIWEAGELNMTPPMRPFQEEKLAMGLFHHGLLEPFWKEQMTKSDYRLLKSIIPKTWIMDPSPLPPSAVLHAPKVNNRSIHSWHELGNASKKEREWILKISGFDETAWGARSVVLATDVSREEWTNAIQRATSADNQSYFVIQNYHKPKRMVHPVYDDNGVEYAMEGRVRLCPYYFVRDGEARLHGILATFCPADKKIIHGMKDAALIPCEIIC